LLGLMLALALPMGALAAIKIAERPVMLYSSVSPKLRIQSVSSAFGNVPVDHIELKFTPTLKPSSYNLSVVSDTVISLALNPGKKWSSPSTTDGMTLYLMSVSFYDGPNQLEDAVPVATIIPTPTIKRNEEVIYMSGTSKLMINGTNFRAKNMELMFEPPLEKDKDYIMSVKSATSLVLTRMTSSVWRDEPGPLKLRRINTGAGALRIDPTYGGITIAEVQANLGAHGVTVETTANERFYQNTGSLVILGNGFNTSHNTLRFANGLRGKGVNYTTVEHTDTQLRLTLASKSKWRANPANLPGPLVLLAVDAGAGFVPVGPTEAKKGRIVATIFETPSVKKSGKTLYKTHSHQLWIVGTGFTRGTYYSKFTFSPEMDQENDVSVVVYNRTHTLINLFEGKAWKGDDSGSLKLLAIDSGAGKYELPGGGVQIAKIKDDAEDHPSGVTITRASQTLYQTAAIRKLIISGSELTEGTKLTFMPPLTADVDYKQNFISASKISLTLKKKKKWRYEGGPLLVTYVDVGLKEGPVKLAYGNGIQVANILQDPTIESSERIIFASHTRRLVIRGTGFALEGTELTLHPTKRSSYEIESLEMTEMVLLLNEGEQWAEVEEGESKMIYVTKVDTGAGEVIFDDDGIVVAKIESDIDDNNCDDSCEWAMDGVCDDGSGKGRYWWDDDYGGFYGYDDDYYGYGYYYYGDDDFLAPVCEEGTDCTDCGGPSTEEPTDCDNSCQWSNDGFCDDSRTSGLCELGTDCHDCGTIVESNFTTWDDDGWWDDDDNYWDIDDNFEYVSGGETKPPVEGDGAGGVFMFVLEGMVYLVGAAVCGAGTYMGVKWYKGQSIPYLAAPTSDLEMRRGGSQDCAEVPITPDVFHT